MRPALYLGIARRHWPLLVASAVVLGALLGAIPLLGQGDYRAETTLRVTFVTHRDGATHPPSPSPAVSPTGPAGPTLPPEAPGRAMARRITTFTQFANSRSLAQDVVTTLRLPYSADELISRIRAETPLGTDVITVSIDDPDPVQAAKIANTIGEKLVEAGEESTAPPGEKEAVVTVTRAAAPPGQPLPSRWWPPVAFGVLAGLAAGLAIAVLRERASPDSGGASSSASSKASSNDDVDRVSGRHRLSPGPTVPPA
jgi:uncharacterized protein involved in exopolysaccharide biosynthesis